MAYILEVKGGQGIVEMNIKHASLRRRHRVGLGDGIAWGFGEGRGATGARCFQ
jgi:hypothetical protein